MPHITGYSERGLVNALFESILSSSDPQMVMSRLLETATLTNRKSVIKYRVGSPIRDFEVFIEPSLSQFGNPDVVLLLDREPSEGESNTVDRIGPYTDVIFIEAKIEGFEQSVNRKPDLRRNHSTVLHELFLKARFAHYLRNNEKSVYDGIPVYDHDVKAQGKNYSRTVGTDPLVLELVELMKGCQTYFFALTTDRGYPATKRTGSFGTGVRIGQWLERIRAANEKTDPALHPGWVSGWWEELTYLWSWHDVLDEARKFVTSGERSMQRCLETIERNKSKFKFPSLDDKRLIQMLTDFASRAGLKDRGGRRSPDRKTFYKNGKAKFTCRIADSFDGPVMETYLLMPDKTRSELTVPFRDIETFVRSGVLSDQLKQITNV